MAQNELIIPPNLPDFIHLQPSTTSSAEAQVTGVFTKVDLEEGYGFGPLEGEVKIKQEKLDADEIMSYDVHVQMQDSETQVSAQVESSWMKYVKHTDNKDQQNLDVQLAGGGVYFVTSRHIKTGEELLLHFEQGDAESAALMEAADDSIEDVAVGASRKKKTYQCQQCEKIFKSASSLKKHKKKHDKVKQLKCTHCQKIFKYKGSLQKHVKRHTENAQTYPCGGCNKVFKSYKKFQTHQEYHKRAAEKDAAIETHIDGTKAKQRYSCDKCEKTFTHKCFLSKHKKLHTDWGIFPCKLCPKVFKLRKYYVKHLTKHTEDRKEFTCDHCQKTFVCSNYLRRHLRVHTGEKPYKCEVCEKSFYQQSDYLRHHRIHTNERKYKCNKCDKAFTTSPILKAHSYIHMDVDPENPIPYKCSTCGKGFKTPLHRGAHERRHIKKDKMKKALLEKGLPDSKVVYKCEPCQITFTRCCLLIRHTAIHSGEKPTKCTYCEKEFADSGAKPFKCDQCGKTYIHEASLNLHIETHRGEKKFQCHICKKRYISTSNLKMHLQLHSTGGEKKHKCNFCDKTFFRQGSLTIHVLTHTGEKPHKCSHCDKAFSQRAGLLKHIRIHTGVKPFQCNTCGKSFTQHSTLVSHNLVHTGEKPFKCKYCEKAFRQSGALGIHMRSHSTEDVSSQEATPRESILPSKSENVSQNLTSLLPSNATDTSAVGVVDTQELAGCFAGGEGLAETATLLTTSESMDSLLFGNANQC